MIILHPLNWLTLKPHLLLLSFLFMLLQPHWPSEGCENNNRGPTQGGSGHRAGRQLCSCQGLHKKVCLSSITVLWRWWAGYVQKKEQINNYIVIGTSFSFWEKRCKYEMGEELEWKHSIERTGGISVNSWFSIIKTYENIYVDAWPAHCKDLSTVAMSNLNSHESAYHPES